MPRSIAFCAGAIVLLGVLTFSNSLNGPFIYDDFGAIRDNTTIRRLWPLTGPLTPPLAGNPMSGRPVVNLSAALNYALSGDDVRGYHIWNVATHILCALLLFAIVRRSLAGIVSPPFELVLALASACVWMVHPLETEPVDHIAARTESMMALCYLLTLYTAIRAGRSGRHAWWAAASVASCAAGMACKESMVTAPLMVVLYDLAFRPEAPRATVRARWRLYAGLAATWFVLVALNWSAPRGHSAGFIADTGLLAPTSPWVYLLNQSRQITQYLRLAIWPSDLVLDYGLVRPLTLGEVAPYVAAMGLLFAAVVVALIRRPKWGYLGAWFFVTLAPTSSVVPIMTEVGAERRMYLPMVALVIAVILAGYFGWRKLTIYGRWVDAIAIVTLAGVSTALVSATRHRNTEYASALTMWQTVVDRWPHGRAHYNLAMALKAAGRRDEELIELRKAVLDSPDARSVLGIELLDRGQVADGISELQTFIRERPDHINVVVAHGRLAEAFFAQQRYRDAIPEYRAYLAHRADAIGPWTNLGISLAATEQVEEALRAFERVVAIAPASSGAQRNLANALLDSHDYGRAVQEAREACRLAPQDAGAREILELALAGQRAAQRVQREQE